MAAAKKSTAKPAASAAQKKLAPAKPVANSPAKKLAATPAQLLGKAAGKPVKKPAVTKPAVTKPAATKAAVAKPAVTKSSVTKPAVAKAAATKAAATKAAVTKPAVTKAAVTKPAAKSSSSQQSSPGLTTPLVVTPQKKANTTPNMSTGSKSIEALRETLPKPRFNKDGLGYTKDFDLPFVKEMFDALQNERVRLTGQAKRLEDEAQQLVQEAEMGDVKFDDEGGEGDSTNVERERDLALSAQARDAVDEIDAALLRIAAGTYGYSVESGRPIPRERLEALPWSSVLVEEKVGGIGRR